MCSRVFKQTPLSVLWWSCAWKRWCLHTPSQQNCSMWSLFWEGAHLWGINTLLQSHHTTTRRPSLGVVVYLCESSCAFEGLQRSWRTCSSSALDICTASPPCVCVSDSSVHTLELSLKDHWFSFTSSDDSSKAISAQPFVTWDHFSPG